jgi:hypothetical protein
MEAPYKKFVYVHLIELLSPVVFLFSTIQSSVLNRTLTNGSLLVVYVSCVRPARVVPGRGEYFL